MAGLGYAAKALVYGVIGVIALLAAAHGRGQATGSRGVAAILSQRFGGWLLGGLAVAIGVTVRRRTRR